MPFHFAFTKPFNGMLDTVVACDATTGYSYLPQRVVDAPVKPQDTATEHFGNTYAKIVELGTNVPYSFCTPYAPEKIYDQMNKLMLSSTERDNVARGYKQFFGAELPAPATATATAFLQAARIDKDIADAAFEATRKIFGPGVDTLVSPAAAPAPVAEKQQEPAAPAAEPVKVYRRMGNTCYNYQGFKMQCP